MCNSDILLHNLIVYMHALLFLEPLDAMKTTEMANTPSTNAAEAGGGGLGISAGTIVGIGVSISAIVVLLTVIATTTIIAVAISYYRHKKKVDKTGTQIHHTSPIYDTIPDTPEPTNSPRGGASVPRHITVLGRGGQINNNMMQQPSHHQMHGSTRARLEGHNNIMILDGSNQQRARESIQVRENEAYMYAVADQYIRVPVQETHPEDYVNTYANRKEVENYIYPVTNKWGHIKQKD